MFSLNNDWYTDILVLLKVGYSSPSSYRLRLKGRLDFVACVPDIDKQLTSFPYSIFSFNLDVQDIFNFDVHYIFTLLDNSDDTVSWNIFALTPPYLMTFQNKESCWAMTRLCGNNDSFIVASFWTNRWPWKRNVCNGGILID